MVSGSGGGGDDAGAGAGIGSDAGDDVSGADDAGGAMLSKSGGIPLPRKLRRSLEGPASSKDASGASGPFGPFGGKKVHMKL
jgi:hypothetical protein